MNNFERIRNLRSRLGMEIGASDDGIYSFSADEREFTIHDLDACDRIVFSGDLGAPPPENKEKL